MEPKTPSPHTDGINIVIPMGGVGIRFAKNGYRFPKPLINIVGRPMLFWLIDNLSVTEKDVIWIALLENVEREFSVSSRLRKEYPNYHFEIISLRFETRGAAETMYIILQHMREDQLERRTISLDCDTFYFYDVLAKFREIPPGYGASYYFKDTLNKPIFSYLALDEKSQIKDIQEKVAISNNANTGAYGFPSASGLSRYCSKILDKAVGSSGEYYISSIIKTMITENVPFLGMEIPSTEFACAGTPAQLQDFLKKIRGGEVKTKKKIRFCFDLDNTLVTYPKVKDDYTSVEPKWKNIRVVQELKNQGHEIIIWTARRMRTHKGNIGKIMKDVGYITLDTLAKFNVPYDELHFGKPDADVYIDDLAVNALIDTEKEIGWYLEDFQIESKPVPSPILPPRSFNTIVELDDTIIKSSVDKSIEGEVYFYRNLPADIAKFFPKIYECQYVEATKMFAIKMQRIRGTTFSHLITHRCVTEGRLTKLLNTLNNIHQSAGAPSDTADVNIYANYADKLTSRFQTYQKLYHSLMTPTSADKLFNMINSFLKSYEQSKKGVFSKVIHGDPVFSNVLLTSEGIIYLLDVRGIVGNTLSLKGDKMYDFAKVYQSLCGYDFLLLDKEVGSSELHYLDTLKKTLQGFLAQHHPEIHFHDVEILTASLLFSLVPLHDNVSLQRNCLQLAAKLVSCEI